MELLELKWTKNFKKLYQTKNSKWTGETDKIGEHIKLHWRNQNSRDEKNAKKPEKGELIILRQYGVITHIVRVLDDKINTESTDKNEFNIYRSVEVIWVTNDWNCPPSTSIFFASGVHFPANGKVYQIKNLKAFKQRWGEGGLIEFQHYLQQELEKY
ncbi:hypothetical protein [Nostoc sphaeroides]|uniref:Uncharacterized protein n=1 Tax=Nostoc sphaeroides CCNUC1 TaxID=2653204 RepID=A0A5P8VVE3_9NOSO|nr:hypothetical protein [Nostoc sphaeroides]QFS44393.1 hypothetical protein GXM_01868 [Nostoc sphaeroides CCNUC1]